MTWQNWLLSGERRRVELSGYFSPDEVKNFAMILSRNEGNPNKRVDVRLNGKLVAIINNDRQFLSLRHDLFRSEP